MQKKTQFLINLYNYLPFWAIQGILHITRRLWGRNLFRKEKYLQAETALQKVFPGKSDREIKKILKTQHNRYTATESLLLFSSFAYKLKRKKYVKWLRRKIVLKNLAALHKCNTPGRGLLLLVPHFYGFNILSGILEVFAGELKISDKPMRLLYLQENDIIPVCNHPASTYHWEIITSDPRALFLLKEQLENKGIAVVHPDFIMPQKGTNVYSFLGNRLYAAATAGWLLYKTKPAAIYANFSRKAGGRIEIEFRAFTDREKINFNNKREAVNQATKAILTVVEESIRRQPGEWILWNRFHLMEAGADDKNQ